jgi:uncharacterized protein YjbI with pentapeptide repeats
MVDFEGANLSGAYLSYANLDGAHLRGACLLMADLDGAKLIGTDLTRATLGWTKGPRKNNFTGLAGKETDEHSGNDLTDSVRWCSSTLAMFCVDVGGAG